MWKWSCRFRSRNSLAADERGFFFFLPFLSELVRRMCKPGAQPREALRWWPQCLSGRRLRTRARASSTPQDMHFALGKNGGVSEGEFVFQR